MTKFDTSHTSVFYLNTQFTSAGTNIWIFKNIIVNFCYLLTAALHLFVFGKGFFLVLFHQFSKLLEPIPENMGNSYHCLIFFPTSESISIVFSISWWETVISFRFRFFPVTLVWFKHLKIFCWLACCCPLEVL